MLDTFLVTVSWYVKIKQLFLILSTYLSLEQSKFLCVDIRKIKEARGKMNNLMF